jgi:hypothetical protein
MGNVANVGDGTQDLAELDGLRIPAHAGTLRSVIDVHVEHAGQAAQVPFIQPQAGRTADIIEQQSRFPAGTDVNDEILLDLRSIEQLNLLEEVRHKLAVGGYGGVGAVPVVVVQAGIAYRLADGMATVTAEGTRLTQDLELRYLCGGG